MAAKHPDLAADANWLTPVQVMAELSLDEAQLAAAVERGLLTPHSWPGTRRKAFDRLEVQARRSMKDLRRQIS